MGGWKTVLDVVTALRQVMLNLSLGSDMYAIHRRKNIGEMPAFPVISSLANCHMWMLYGTLTGSYFPVAASQSFGQLAAYVFNIIYFRWSPIHKRKEAFKFYAIFATVYCAVTIYFVLVMTGVTGQTNDEASTVLGYVAVVVNVCMFASPLSTLKRVVETKSASSIPMNLSLMIFVSSALWVVTGLLDNDWFIAGLNLAGVLLGAVQILMYFIYRSGRVKDAQDLPIATSPTSKNTDVEFLTEPPEYKLVRSPIRSQDYLSFDS